MLISRITGMLSPVFAMAVMAVPLDCRYQPKERYGFTNGELLRSQGSNQLSSSDALKALSQKNWRDGSLVIIDRDAKGVYEAASACSTNLKALQGSSNNLARNKMLYLAITAGYELLKMSGGSGSSDIAVNMQALIALLNKHPTHSSKHAGVITSAAQLSAAYIQVKSIRATNHEAQHLIRQRVYEVIRKSFAESSGESRGYLRSLGAAVSRVNQLIDEARITKEKARQEILKIVGCNKELTACREAYKETMHPNVVQALNDVQKKYSDIFKSEPKAYSPVTTKYSLVRKAMQGKLYPAGHPQAFCLKYQSEQQVAEGVSDAQCISISENYPWSYRYTPEPLTQFVDLFAMDQSLVDASNVIAKSVRSGTLGVTNQQAVAKNYVTALKIDGVYAPLDKPVDQSGTAPRQLRWGEDVFSLAEDASQLVSKPSIYWCMFKEVKDRSKSPVIVLEGHLAEAATIIHNMQESFMNSNVNVNKLCELHAALGGS